MEWLVYLAGVGLVLIILGIINIITYNNKKKKYVRTIGYIARYETVPRKNYNTYGAYVSNDRVAIINFRVGTCTYWVRDNKISINLAIPGTPKEVYYNPNDPNEAILGNDRTGIMKIIVGTILLGISLYVILGIISNV